MSDPRLIVTSMLRVRKERVVGTRRQRREKGIPVTRATPDQLTDRVRQSKNAGPMRHRNTKRNRGRAAQRRRAIGEASE